MGQERTVRLERPFGPDGRAALVITQRGEATAYHLDRLESDWGEAFALDKGGATYHVMIGGEAPGCDCPDGTFRGHLRPCKHYAALAALKKQGRI